MSEPTPGRRVYPNTNGNLSMKPCDYGKDPYGLWWVRPPRGSMGQLVNHTVTEHQDGTITVSPSILLEAGIPEKSWHGYLEHGEWREC